MKIKKLIKYVKEYNKAPSYLKQQLGFLGFIKCLAIIDDPKKTWKEKNELLEYYGIQAQPDVDYHQ